MSLLELIESRPDSTWTLVIEVGPDSCQVSAREESQELPLLFEGPGVEDAS